MNTSILARKQASRKTDQRWSMNFPGEILMREEVTTGEIEASCDKMQSRLGSRGIRFRRF